MGAIAARRTAVRSKLAPPRGAANRVSVGAIIYPFWFTANDTLVKSARAAVYITLRSN